MVDSVRTLLNELIRTCGMSRSEVSRSIGRNRAYIHQFMLGRPKNLPERERQRLGALFGVDPERFRGDETEEMIRPLNARLVGRANAAVGVLGLQGETAAEAFASIYALIEREAAGHPITDDEPTLRIIRRLIDTIRRNG